MREILTHMPEAAERLISTGGLRGINTPRFDGTEPSPSSRPRRRYRNRQMRERRTAHVLMGFGILLACVELFILFWVL